MSREAGSAIAVGVILLIAGSVLLLGLAGGSSTVSYRDEVPLTSIATDGSAVVTGKSQSGGVKVIGVQLQQPDSFLDVALAVPAECVTTDASGEASLREDGECAELPVHGPLIGDGVTPEGARVVAVKVLVSSDCYEAVALGSAWPSDLEACAAG